MMIRISDSLWADVMVPLLNCTSFEIIWKPDEHALLSLEGYLEPKSSWSISQLYGSRIKIWLEADAGEQVLFYGRLNGVTEKTVAGTRRVYVQGISASVILDENKHSRSFQDIEKSLYTIIREAAESEGGQVICTADKEKRPAGPVIQYEETNWEFSRRIASHLNVPLVPDIITGEPNFWIGMRKGMTIPSFPETSYIVELSHGVVQYRVKSTGNYQLGDKSTLGKEEVIIYEKQIRYQRGELLYDYVLIDPSSRKIDIWYQGKFTGISLEGVVRNTKDESMSIALDMDGGRDTGEYFYEWQPETGNILYAMPETGSPVSLYLPNEDEQKGIAIHCIHREPTKAYKRTVYNNRELNVIDSQSIGLSDTAATLSKSSKHNIILTDGELSSNTTEKITIVAEGKIKLEANNLAIRTPDKIDIWQE